MNVTEPPEPESTGVCAHSKKRTARSCKQMQAAERGACHHTVLKDEVAVVQVDGAREHPYSSAD